MEDFFKLILYFVFGYVAVYVGGWILLAMLPFILEVWYVWALFGLAFIIIEIRHAYRHMKYLEQQKEEEKRKRLERKALSKSQQQLPS